MKRKIILSLIVFVLLGISISFIVFAPSTKSNKMLEEKFLDEKSEYMGVVTCWNIDTFESGTASKSSFLQKMAMQFEKKNRGVFLFVKNMTVDECLLQLEEGNKPNLFSFGEGVYDLLKPYLCKNDEEIQIKNIIKNNKDLSYAKPWCFGFYTLISTSAILEKSGNADKIELTQIIDKCSYEKKYKKSTRVVDSFVYGGAAYTNIKKVLSTYSSNVVDNTNTFFEAYDQFVNGKASILCGTQRDIARMDNRVSLGKIDGYVYTPILSSTDLVQYLGFSDSGNDVVNTCAKKFIDFILSSNVQSQLSQIGMLAARDGVIANTAGNVVGDVEIKFS